jgi:hypothetical protein
MGNCTLVLPDRPAEQGAALRVVGRFCDEPLGVADAFRRDQDALGVHAGENVAEALTLLADQIVRWHAQVVEEHLGGGVVHHGADRIDGEVGRLRQMHVDQKYRQTVGARLGLLLRRGARQEQHQVGMLGARGPDLLPVDDVMVVALAPRRGAQRQRVGARRRLGDAESLQAQLAAGDFRQIGLLLRGAAMPQDGAHGVHLRVAGGAVATRGMHLFQDRASGADAQPAAAKLFGDERGEIAGFSERTHELGRIGALAVERAPVFAGELGAQRAHRLADVGMVVDVGTALAHAVTSARP